MASRPFRRFIHGSFSFEFRTLPWICLASFSLLPACSIRPVVVQGVDNMRIENSMTRPVMAFELRVHNPNRTGVRLLALDSRIFLDSTEVAVVHMAKPIHIAASGGIPVPLRAEPSLGSLARLVKAGVRPTEGSATGTLTVRKFVFKKTFPFSGRFSMP